MAVRNDYEVSVDGAVRHWDFPYARLENTTPDATQPAAVLSGTDGDQMSGTVIGADDDDSIATIDVTAMMVYKHYVRTVATYNGGDEATWSALNIGMKVYYDRSSTMPTDAFLSVSPLDEDGDANPVFGRIVAIDDDDMDNFPLAAGASGNTHEVAVMQVGVAAETS